MMVTVTQTVTVSNCVNAAPTGATNGGEVAGAAVSCCDSFRLSL